MDITSLKFLFLFLPVFVILYLVARNELRLLLITIANLVFLIWGQRSAILWLSLILVSSYSLGLYLSSEKGKGKAAWLWVGISINLLLLSFFKFYAVYGLPFLSSPGLPELLRQPLTSLTVPIGIPSLPFKPSPIWWMYVAAPSWRRGVRFGLLPICFSFQNWSLVL